jgi:2-keto-4-pentenoate hydratase
MAESDMSDEGVARGMTAQLTRLRERVSEGDRCIGWKLAYSTGERKQKFGLTAPLTGYLTERAVTASGGLLTLAEWTKAVVEPEIAVYMGRDLGCNADRDAIGRAIRGIGPALELADVVKRSDDIAEILALNIYQRGVVLGPCDTSRAGGDLSGVRARVYRNQKEIADTTDPEALPGELIELVGCAANRLAECGEALRTGQVIITGTIIPPLVVQSSEEIAFSLEPIGSISIRFTASP